MFKRHATKDLNKSNEDIARRAMLGYGGKKKRTSSRVWWGKFCKALVFGTVVIVIGIYRFGSVNQENSSAKQHKGAKEEIHKSDMMKIKILEDKAQVELLTCIFDSADKLYAKILDNDPEHGESLYVRGIIRTTRGDSKSLNEGIEYFKRALHADQGGQTIILGWQRLISRWARGKRRF